MKKALLSLVSLLTTLGAVSGMSPVPHHRLNMTPFGFQKASKFDPSDAKLFIPRGGSDAVEPLDSLDFASGALIQLFGILNAFHGIILAVIPNIGRKLLGSKIDEDDDTATYAEEAVGVFAIEYGLTGYLAATGRTSPERAIGYGTLLDLYFLTKNLLNGKFKKFGVEKLMTVMTLIAAGGTGAILTDRLHLGPVIEVMTLMPAVIGSMKYFDPIGSGKKMLGTDLTTRPEAKALYRFSGMMKLVSAVLRGALAFGVAPLKALGYAELFEAVLIADSIIFRKTADDIENENALTHQLASLGLSLAMGAVFILKSE